MKIGGQNWQNWEAKIDKLNFENVEQNMWLKTEKWLNNLINGLENHTSKWSMI
jgi:hypothetical protein